MNSTPKVISEYPAANFRGAVQARLQIVAPQYLNLRA